MAQMEVIDLATGEITYVDAPPPEPPTADDYAAAVQARIDLVAVKRNYKSGDTLAGYATSTYAPWASDASAFIAWRDQVWLYVFQKQADVEAGKVAQPTIDELVASLPTPPWPVSP